MLAENAERLTLIRMFEALGWLELRAPGEAYQFDWSHEVVLIGGATVTVKAAHIRLCRSRMMLVRLPARECKSWCSMRTTVLSRSFAACTRGNYDNMQTAVERSW